MSGAGSNTPANDFAFEVGLGNVPGVRGEVRSGFNGVINGTPEDIWNVGGQMTYLTAAETLDIVSDSALDVSPASGAHTIFVQGLDNNFDEINEVIALNGLTPVVTVNSYIRLFNITTVIAGVSESNTGTITATATTSAVIQGQMEPTTNGSLTLQYTIPNAKTGLLSSFNFSSGSMDQIQFNFLLRIFGTVFIQTNTHQIISSAFDFDFNPYAPIPAKTDIRVLAFQIAGGGTVSASAILQFYIIDD